MTRAERIEAALVAMQNHMGTGWNPHGIEHWATWHNLRENARFALASPPEEGDYERGYRAGIEAAAKVADGHTTVEEDGGDYDRGWCRGAEVVARDIRALAAPAAPKAPERALPVDSTPGTVLHNSTDCAILPLVDEKETLSAEAKYGDAANREDGPGARVAGRNENRRAVLRVSDSGVPGFPNRGAVAVPDAADVQEEEPARASGEAQGTEGEGRGRAGRTAGPAPHPLADTFRPYTREQAVAVARSCPVCEVEGPWGGCPACHGTGHHMGVGSGYSCPTCRGSGREPNREAGRCDDCDGTGWLTFSDGTRAKCAACGEPNREAGRCGCGHTLGAHVEDDNGGCDECSCEAFHRGPGTKREAGPNGECPMCRGYGIVATTTVLDAIEQVCPGCGGTGRSDEAARAPNRQRCLCREWDISYPHFEERGDDGRVHRLHGPPCDRPEWGAT